jgi:hypothetical protein
VEVRKVLLNDKHIPKRAGLSPPHKVCSMWGFQADSDGAGEIAINLVGDDAELHNSTDRPVRADWYTAATTRMSRTPDSIDTGAGWPSLAASRNSRC